MGISLFLITKYNKYIIFKVLTSFIKANIKDLILNKVTIIEGFYINIVLEALIAKVRA